MSWRDQLRQASFRGIGCLYDSTEAERGRRVVVHEYPGRDEPDVEDLGRRTRRHRLELYLLASVLGDDYWPTVDRLTDALEAEGEGTLVHPYRGPLQCYVEDFRVSTSTREGGMTRFSVSFVEASAPREPTARLDTAEVMVARADALESAQKARFMDRFNTQGWPEYVRDHARRVLDAAVESLGLPSGVIGEVNNALGIADVLQSARAELATLGLPRIRPVLGFGAGLADPDTATPAGQVQAENQGAVVDMVRGTALTAAVDAAAATDFESRDDALAVRDELLAAIDERSEVAGDDEYIALIDLREALVRDLNTRGAQLERVVTYTPPATLPALVLAHQLYGDATREAEIVARNRRVIRHPGFVPGGEVLEVLTDAA